MLWSRYLAEIADLREGIHFTRIGGQEPVFVFHEQSIAIFDKLQKNIDSGMMRSFKHINFNNKSVDISKAGIKAQSSTWTYLINDDPFNNMLGIQFIGTIAFSIGAGLLWPLIAVYSLMRKFSRKNKHSRI
jgi:preprotein translocase subunit SecA